VGVSALLHGRPVVTGRLYMFEPGLSILQGSGHEQMSKSPRNTARRPRARVRSEIDVFTEMADPGPRAELSRMKRVKSGLVDCMWWTHMWISK
jgi:hypothetical protein